MTVTVAIEEEERKELVQFFAKLDMDVLKATATAISMMVKAFEGEPPEAEDIITRLINVKDILERGNFPTYPLLAKQVYLRLIALYNPQAYACRDWADLEARALTSYKARSRDDYVEMTRGVMQPDQQQFIFGGAPRSAEAQAPPKKRFWQRKPKQEPSEFTHQ